MNISVQGKKVRRSMVSKTFTRRAKGETSNYVSHENSF